MEKIGSSTLTYVFAVISERSVVVLLGRRLFNLSSSNFGLCCIRSTKKIRKKRQHLAKVAFLNKHRKSLSTLRNGKMNLLFECLVYRMNEKKT